MFVLADDDDDDEEGVKQEVQPFKSFQRHQLDELEKKKKRESEIYWNLFISFLEFLLLSSSSFNLIKASKKK